MKEERAELSPSSRSRAFLPTPPTPLWMPGPVLLSKKTKRAVLQPNNKNHWATPRHTPLSRQQTSPEVHGTLATTRRSPTCPRHRLRPP